MINEVMFSECRPGSLDGRWQSRWQDIVEKPGTTRIEREKREARSEKKE